MSPKNLFDQSGLEMSEPKMKKPSLFRTAVMGIVYAWRRVMDVKYNPLKYVPDPSLQAYFMLVLFIAWSLFFGVLAVNYLGFFDYNVVVSIIVHTLVLMPLAFTMQFLLMQKGWCKMVKRMERRTIKIQNRCK